MNSLHSVAAVAEEEFLYVGPHVVLPDAFNIGLFEVRLHEVAGPDGGVPVLPQQLVGPLHHVGNPLHIRRLLQEITAQQPPDGVVVRVELHKVEAAPQGQVHQSDGPVGGVHRSDYVEVARQGKWLFRVVKLHLMVPVLE